MPYIETKTTVKATEAQAAQLKSELGKAIELIPGKSEGWLMTHLCDNCTMSFQGDAEKDCAMVSVDIFGSADRSAYDALTAAICETVSRVLGIDKGRIYVKYSEVGTWGFDGYNF